MGCISNRHQDEEHIEAIAAQELSLNFYKSSPIEMENLIKKFANEGKINQQQLNKIIESAKLKVPERGNLN